MSTRYLVTGATGFVGSHIAETLVRRGRQVCTIARPQSNTHLLEELGVEIHRGEFSDSALLQQLIPEVNGVIHCAARVGDWGPVEEYRAVNVEGLRRLLEICKGQALERFIHMSSLGVYPLRHHHGTAESEPLPRKHLDGYSQSKVEAEELALHYYREFEVPVTVLRPGFVYGPRDRTVMPRLIEALRQGTLRYPGARGRRALNTIFVGNLVQAVLLALDEPQAVGQVYNLTDGEYVSKRRFVEAVADALDLPRPWRAPPLWAARLATWGCESWARLTGARQAPLFTYARLKFFGYNLDFSIEKAKSELGYQPRHDFADGMSQTMGWYREQMREQVSAPV